MILPLIAILASAPLPLTEPFQPGPAMGGVTVPPVPQGYKLWGAHFIEPDHAISIYERDGTKYWFVEKMLFRTPEGKPVFEIKQTYVQPHIMKDEWFIIDDCKDASGMKNGLVALVRYEDKDWLTDVRRTWQLNLNTSSLEPIPIPRGLVCINESSGVDD